MSIGVCSMSRTRKSKPAQPIASAFAGEPDTSHVPTAVDFDRIACLKRFFGISIAGPQIDVRLGNCGRVAGLEKVEIAAFVGLRDVPLVQHRITSPVTAGRRLPCLPCAAAVRRRRRADGCAAPDVDRDQVAAVDQRQRAADRALRRDVQHARAVVCSAHARVRDADHVAHALREQLFRDREVAPFGKPRCAHRACIAQDQHGVTRDRKPSDRR